MMQLRLHQVVTPDSLLDGSVEFLLLLIDNPKNKRLFARRCHVRIAEPLIVEAVSRWVEDNQKDRRACAGTSAQWRAMWHELMAFIDISSKQGIGCTLSSFRGGGATHCYLTGMSLSDIAWTSRWASQRTLEIYIQEVAALLSLAALTGSSRERILRLVNALPQSIRGVNNKNLLLTK